MSGCLVSADRTHWPVRVTIPVVLPFVFWRTDTEFGKVMVLTPTAPEQGSEGNAGQGTTRSIVRA